MKRLFASLVIAAALLTGGAVTAPHAAAGVCPAGTVAVGATVIDGKTFIVCADLSSLKAVLVPLH